MNKLPEVVVDSRRCRKIVDELSREKVLAVDCEGVMLGIEGPLTLIQIGTYGGIVYLFDIQENKRLLSDGRLRDILESTSIVKVIQSCSNDSAALYHQFKVLLQNVFDTQIANIVIQEHQGRRLAPLLKLEVICEKYSINKTVSENKSDVQTAWTKEVGDLWAKRPLTEDMITYAAGDVIAIIPEVYENQKKLIEDNGLWSKYQSRVHEEINYFIDPKMKSQRKERVAITVDEIIKRIISTSSADIRLSDFVEDGDEFRALKRLDFRDASNKSPLINRLKTESIRQELRELDEKLKAEGDDFYLNWRHGSNLFAYQKHPEQTISADAYRLQKEMNAILLKDITKKYNMKTPLKLIRQMEKETLRSLRPSGINDPNFAPVVLHLYWLLMEDDLEKKITEFQEKRQNFKIMESYYRKLKFYIAKRTSVPVTIKRKAKMFKDELDMLFGRDVIPN